MTNWTQAEYPVAPWDSPDLPPRRIGERCKTHPWIGEGHAACAYRDDDPAICPICHVNKAKGCAHIRTRPENGVAHATAINELSRSAITCGGCDQWWTGLSCAHCSACHRTFTGIYGFDMHRRGGQCLDPVTIGLVPADKPWPGWSRPGTWTGPEE